MTVYRTLLAASCGIGTYVVCSKSHALPSWFRPVGNAHPVIYDCVNESNRSPSILLSIGRVHVLIPNLDSLPCFFIHIHRHDRWKC